MGDLIEEEIDFRGGTLQLSGELNDTLSNGGTDAERILQAPPVHPSVLSGADSISSASEFSDAQVNSPTGANGSRAVYPRYDMPFSAENINDFFSYRNGIVEAAVQECITGLIFPESDGEVIGSWLLTEITLWDNERERLVLLTTKMILTIKYDFIAMKQLEFKKTFLCDLDTIIIGELQYPPSSIVPRLNGIASGVTTVVRDCIVERLARSRQPRDTHHSLFDAKYFEPRVRNLRGIRLMWNKGEPLSFKTAWNPFSRDAPFLTFASHPVYWHKGTETVMERSTYDMESFAENVVAAVEQLGQGGCCIHHAPIVIQSYVGVTSLLHNKASLGFFKVRGKFSF